MEGAPAPLHAGRCRVAAGRRRRAAGRPRPFLRSYPLLFDMRGLCGRTGSRPAGSPACDRAIEWAVAKLRGAGAGRAQGRSIRDAGRVDVGSGECAVLDRLAISPGRRAVQRPRAGIQKRRSPMPASGAAGDFARLRACLHFPGASQRERSVAIVLEPAPFRSSRHPRERGPNDPALWVVPVRHGAVSGAPAAGSAQRPIGRAPQLPPSAPAWSTVRCGPSVRWGGPHVSGRPGPEPLEGRSPTFLRVRRHGDQTARHLRRCR